MSNSQPSTPHTNPKGPVHGAPMGTRKVPLTPSKKETSTPDVEQPVEEPSTPVPKENPINEVDEAKDVEDKPEQLDEAIDLGDEGKGEAQEGAQKGVEEGAKEGLETAKSNVEGVSEPNWQPEDGTEKSEEAPTEIPDEAQSQIPDDAQTQIPDEAQSEIPDDAQSQLPDEAQSQIPDEAQSQIPDDAQSQIPDEARSQIPEGSQVPEDEDARTHAPGENGTEIPEDAPTELPGEDGEEPLSFAILEGKKLNKGGFVVDEKGNPVGKLIEGDAKKLAGKTVDAEGNIWNDSGKVIGKAEPIPTHDQEQASTSPFEDFPDAVVDASGKILFENRKIGIVTEGNPKELAGKKVDADGDILDKHGNVIGKAIREDDEEPEPEAEPEEEKVDCSALAGLRVNKAGNVINDSGKLVGRVVSGVLKALVNKTVDAEGNIYNDTGKVIGRAEPIPDDEKEDQNETPFEDFPGAIVEKSGDVVHEGKVIGKVIEGDPKKLAGKSVDPEGDIIDKNGTVVGKAERWEEEEVPEEVVDKSILAGKRVNKAGNVVDSSGTIYGKLVEGDVKALAGKMCDKQGFVRNEAGDIVGKADLVPEGEREGMKTGPFADFPGCTVTKDGKVTCDQGIVGRLIEGDANKLFGKSVDEDGDVVDKNGNVLGKAERWEEEAVKKDVNPMSGLKVNKSGDVYNLDGELVGKLTDGDLNRCAGQKIDDDGDVIDQKGSSVGHVSLISDIPEKKDVHPLSGLKVNKDGDVYNLDGELIGKLTDGDLSRCAGRKIDDEGDVVDQKGTSIGHVSLISDIPEKKDVHPLSGLKVNKDGDVYNLDGDLVGKLTEGTVSTCAGRKIDDEGDVVDQKGNSIGHVSLIQDIPEPEPEVEEETETEEEKKAREQSEEDKKLATQMANVIQNALDRIHPVLKLITETIDKAERKPKEELDEQKVVDEVKPLIEEGGRILTETNGAIRGLDPDGRIAETSKAKTAAREATPEEYRLADLLKELTGTVTQTIDNAKKKIADMPHAKKELNPLWGLLSEPLFQILAAVGLLLSGVLGLVAQLLNGLGLGGLVRGLLGGLGVTRVLEGLGLGGVFSSLTGSKKK